MRTIAEVCLVVGLMVIGIYVAFGLVYCVVLLEEWWKRLSWRAKFIAVFLMGVFVAGGGATYLKDHPEPVPTPSEKPIDGSSLR